MSGDHMTTHTHTHTYTHDNTSYSLILIVSVVVVVLDTIVIRNDDELQRNIYQSTKKFDPGLETIWKLKLATRLDAI